MKKITVALMRDLEKQVQNEEISYSRMVEILNEISVNHNEMESKFNEVKYKGVWTPEYLATQLLFPKLVSIQTAQTLLKSWASDIIEVNK